MIHIIIPIFNAMAYLEGCLGSLRTQTYRDFRTIVVDDGSSDGSGEFIREKYPEVTVLRGTGDWWWTKSMNAGIGHVLDSTRAGDFILSLNIDLHVGPDYLERLIEIAGLRKPCVVGSASVDRDKPDHVVFAGVDWNPWTARYKGVSAPRIETSRGTEYWLTDMLPGRGTLFPAEVFKNLGLYDDVHLPQYAADDDMSLRARKNGYALLIAPGAVVYSHVSATGLNFKVSGDSDIRALWKSMMSIRSPFYLKARFHFARVHGKVPPAYFLLDLGRTCGSFFLHALRKRRSPKSS